MKKLNRILRKKRNLANFILINFKKISFQKNSQNSIVESIKINKIRKIIKNFKMILKK